MIELGGNIKLDNFDYVDLPTLIIVKKLVGNYAKKIHDNIAPFDELKLKLIENNVEGKRVELGASLTSNEKVCEAFASDVNLFFAIDKALSKIMADIQH